MTLTDAVAQALDELRRGLPDLRWDIRDDGEGGAIIIAEALALGGVWAQADTWIGFRVPFNYPYADIYPHFVRGDLARRDGGPLGEAMSVGSFEGRPAIQLSRRSTHRVPGLETALIKLHKVTTWLRSR